jgi:hypothetical protein
MPVIDYSAWRKTAARIERDYPQWLIMWSPYYEEYWAYPRFRVPQGTVLHDADPGELVAEMRAVQKAAAQAARVVAGSAGGGMWGG